MGMFDDIDFETVCPSCHSVVKGFQSKDNKCQLLTLKPWEVENFYSSCPKCRKWIEYQRIEPLPPPEPPPEPPGWLDKYRLLFEHKEHNEGDK